MIAVLSIKLNLCINNKDVAFVVNKDITRNEIPNLVLAVCKTAILIGLFKTKGCHIGVNLNLCGRMGISDSWLDNDRLDGATIKACKAMERIIGC